MNWMKNHKLGVTLVGGLSVLAAIALGYLMGESKKHKEEDAGGRVFALRKKAS